MIDRGSPAAFSGLSFRPRHARGDWITDVERRCSSSASLGWLIGGDRTHANPGQTRSLGERNETNLTLPGSLYVEDTR